MEPHGICELDGSELDRANAVYASLAFEPSKPADRTFGAFDGERLIALGRVVPYDDGGLELGGFWTAPDERGRGLARRMVAFVLARLPTGRRVHLVSFAHLADFYRSCGFRDSEAGQAPPASIRAKISLCARRAGEGVYHPTVLLVRTT